MIEERYYQTLNDIHAIMQPKNYLEVGVRRGDSWKLVRGEIPSLGIDPEPKLCHQPGGKARLFAGTSDDFFAEHDPKALLDGPIDLAFVDGMHLFEFALRDFSNIEKNAHKDAIILVHDCLPISEETAGRDPLDDIWTGDIWKLIVCLKSCRPDLRIDVLDTSPSGLGVISNLNPEAVAWREGLDATIERFVNLPYAYLGRNATLRSVLNVCETTSETLENLFHRHVGPTKPAKSSLIQRISAAQLS